MYAGEVKNIAVEFGWQYEGTTKDFGLVALGQEGTIKLTHEDGLESQSWPGADLVEEIPASTVTPPEISAPFDSADLAYVTNVRHTLIPKAYICETTLLFRRPFEDYGDDTRADHFSFNCYNTYLRYHLVFLTPKFQYVGFATVPGWKESCIQTNSYTFCPM